MEEWCGRIGGGIAAANRTIDAQKRTISGSLTTKFHEQESIYMFSSWPNTFVCATQHTDIENVAVQASHIVIFTTEHHVYTYASFIFL